MSWWLAPGIAVFGVSLVLTVGHIALGLARRPRLQLWLKAVFLRRVGIGLLLVGLGINWVLPAVSRGPDLGGLIFGAIVSGLGGLYFISLTDPLFKDCRSVAGWRPPRVKDHSTGPEDDDAA